jgi:hypothetical protein
LLNKQKDQIETLLKDMKLIKGMIERLTRVQNLATTSTKTPRTTKPETNNSPTTYPPTTRPEMTSSPATPSSTFAEATCPDSSWFRKSDSCYKFNNSYEKTWMDAKADCETRGKCIKAIHAHTHTHTHAHTHTHTHIHSNTHAHTGTMFL